jgi:hypothetical protein
VLATECAFEWGQARTKWVEELKTTCIHRTEAGGIMGAQYEHNTRMIWIQSFSIPHLRACCSFFWRRGAPHRL